MPSMLKLCRILILTVCAVWALGVHAAPITQVWFNDNPDVPQGPFDGVAFKFISQSNGQTGFANVVVSPINGWTQFGFDPQLTYAAGSINQQIQFALTFEGAASDSVAWDIWYYLDHQVQGGARYSGNVGRTSFSFAVLEVADAPPALPEPASWLLASVALGLCLWASRGRRPGIRPAVTS
jgi:hypothetical protein